MGLSVNDVTGIGAVSDFLKDVADKIWPDPAERDQYLLKAQELDAQMAAGQAAIDVAEAQSNSAFARNWRPFLGWGCVVIFLYHFLIVPIIYFYLSLEGIVLAVPLPAFDIQTVKDVLEGILGLYGTQRTFEKMGEKGHLPWQK